MYRILKYFNEIRTIKNSIRLILMFLSYKQYIIKVQAVVKVFRTLFDEPTGILNE